jgi:hypothetical protein
MIKIKKASLDRNWFCAPIAKSKLNPILHVRKNYKENFIKVKMEWRKSPKNNLFFTENGYQPLDAIWWGEHCHIQTSLVVLGLVLFEVEQGNVLCWWEGHAIRSGQHGAGWAMNVGITSPGINTETSLEYTLICRV